MTGDEEHTLTTREVARLFRVNVKTPARWAKSGKLSAIRTPGGRDLRFRESEVRALLEGGADDGR